MGQSSAQAHAFFSDVAKNKKLWTVIDANGTFLSSDTSSGKKSYPFWSTVNRVKKIISNVEGLQNYQPHELSFEVFKTRWIPGMEKDGYLVGLNWSGKNATGFDFEPAKVLEAIEKQIDS